MHGVNSQSGNFDSRGIGVFLGNFDSSAFLKIAFKNLMECFTNKQTGRPISNKRALMVGFRYTYVSIGYLHKRI